MKTTIKERYTTMYEGFDPTGKYQHIYFGTCYTTKAEADRALCEAMSDAEADGWARLQGDIICHTYAK